MRQNGKSSGVSVTEAANSAGRLDGQMLLKAAEMRRAEAEVMPDQDAAADLMETAGQAVFDMILSHRPMPATGRAVVLCGPGGNGADGYVVARLLAHEGWTVSVFALGAPDALPAAAAVKRAEWDAIGPVRSIDEAEDAVVDADLVVDALFGIGLSRPMQGTALARLIGALEPRRVVSVDVPSGLCADSGRVIGDLCVAAGLTVSFQTPKPGHLLERGPELCGALSVVDIGVPASSSARITAAPSLLSKAGGGHKYGQGHALVLAGGPGKGGAARMAARAALRIGAGLVTIGCPAAALQENAAQLNAIMLRRLDSAEKLGTILEDARLNAICLGPGLGLGSKTQALVGAALAARRGTVLDADALTSFEGSAAELFDQLHEDCLLTPHDGEFARLFPDLADPLTGPVERGPAPSRIDAVRSAAARAGCAVLLKGPATVVAAPDGKVLVNAGVYDRAAPWLATAGAGDVLSGFACGLMARGRTAFAAGGDAAWLHVAAARRFGPGLIAEDLSEALPGVFRDLGI